MCGTLLSCQEPYTREVEPPKTNLEDSEVTYNKQFIPEALLSLGSNERYVPQEGNLFGRFYNERAEFFIIDNPQNTLYDVQVNSVVLCYLDGFLSKTTYFLNENVANKLVSRYGSFRISGHDFENRELINKREIWENREYKRLSEKLDDFRMSWTLGDQEIVYEVDLNKNNEKFVYIEMTDQYKNLLRVIEKEY